MASLIAMRLVSPPFVSMMTVIHPAHARGPESGSSPGKHARARVDVKDVASRTFDLSSGLRQTISLLHVSSALEGRLFHLKSFAQAIT